MYKLEVEIWNNFMICILLASHLIFTSENYSFLADLFAPELPVLLPIEPIPNSSYNTSQNSCVASDSAT